MAKTVYFSKTITTSNNGSYNENSLEIENTIPVGTHKISITNLDEIAFSRGGVQIIYNSWVTFAGVNFNGTFPYIEDIVFPTDCVSPIDNFMITTYIAGNHEITIEIYDETDDTTDYKHAKYNMLVNGKM